MAPGSQRGGLQPWFDETSGTGAPSPATRETRVSLEELRRFFGNPARAFLQQRLGLRLAGDIDDSDDVEPLLAPERGLDHQRVQQHALAALLQGEEDGLYARLRARALLPSGALGKQQFAELLERLRPCARAFKQWDDGMPAQPWQGEAEINGITVHGRIERVHAKGLPRLLVNRKGQAMSAGWALRNGLDWLLVNAAGARLPLLRFIDAEQNGNFGPHPLPALSAEQARAALNTLLRLREQGLRAPLRFALYAGWNIYNDASDLSEENARKHWLGNEHGDWNERNDEALQLVFRGADPFASESAAREFIDNSRLIFGAVCEGKAGIAGQGSA